MSIRLINSGRFTRIFRVATLIVATVAIASRSVDAQLFTWIDPAGGSYNNSFNWSPLGVPNTLGESAQFNLAANYSVLHSSGGNSTVDNLSVLDGSVTFATQSSVFGRISVNDTATVAGGQLILDEAVGAGDVRMKASRLEVNNAGSFVADGATVVEVTDTLSIGDFASDTHGTVAIQGGSTLTLDTTDNLALTIGANGLTPAGVSKLTITGAGTSMATPTFGVDVYIGDEGAGSLEILDGASVNLPLANLYFARTTNGRGSTLLLDGGAVLDTFDADPQTYGVTWIGSGTFGDADVQVLGGSRFVPGQTIVTGRSTIMVDGVGSEIEALRFGIEESSDVVVQNQGKLRMLGGGGDAILDGSTLTVTGTGSVIEAFTGLGLRGTSSGSQSRIDVLAGGVITPAIDVVPGFSLELYMDDHSVLNVSGAGSLYDFGDASLQTDSTTAGAEPQIYVSGGGMVKASQFQAHDARVELDGGTIESEFDVEVGGSLSGNTITNRGFATIDLLPGGTLEVGRNLELGDDGTVNLYGGTLNLPSFANVYASDADPINWNNGTVNIDGDDQLTPSSAELFMPGGELNFGQRLEVIGTLDLVTTLTVDGGELRLLGLTGAHLLRLESGRFEYLDDDLVIGAGGPLGEEFELKSGMTLFSDQDILVEGILIAAGRVDSSLVNAATGTIRIEQSNTLSASTALFNAGLVQLQGGQMDVGGNLTISATGNVVGRGVIDVGGTLTNSGDLAFSNGQTDIFGDVNNQATGRVLVSGNSDVTFWDDVVHTGVAFNVSVGSSATFFGTAGFGVTGGGDVFFEGDITPGSSPGLETFEANVFLSSLSDLEIEIAGPTKGTDYDSLAIDLSASVSGGLTVSLLDYTPSLGETFEIITADGGVSGAFSSEQFPSFDPALTFHTFYGANSVTLAVTPALPGDYNADGTVNLADYTVWRDSLGAVGVGLAADGDFSGGVDASDYQTWKNNFGASLPVIPSTASVPEPAAWCLMLLSLLAIWRQGVRSTII